MKLWVLGSVLLVAVSVVAEKISWTNQRSEEWEIECILNDVACIQQRYKKSCIPSILNRELSQAVFRYLKFLATPASFKVLKMLIDSGELSEYFLDAA